MAQGDELRRDLITALRRDASLHEAGQYEELGENFDHLDEDRSRWPSAHHPQRSAIVYAWNFWEDWLDERNHRFPKFDTVTKDQWPNLASGVAPVKPDRLAG